MPLAEPENHMTYREQAEQIVAAQQAKRDSHRTGVAWSAMAPDAPKVETVEAVEARITAEAERLAAFKASPRGRFIAALGQLQNAGEWAITTPLWTLESQFYFSGFGRPGEALRVEYVGRAISLLNESDHHLAREAISALSDMLAAEKTPS